MAIQQDMANPANQAVRGKVPVVGLTGHLGAGKTSLLNHLLRFPGARLGVVVNDFGTVNVDAALVAGQIDEAASISGGCLCCLPEAGGLDNALEKLSQPQLRLDAIVVEASGVADPVALARLIRFSGAKRVRPGGIIEVVDAVEHFRTVDIWPEPPLRYAAANLVVVGKTDLLSANDRDAKVARIRERVRERNPHASVVIARQGRIDPALVFDTVENEDPVDQLPIARLLREDAHDRHSHEHARAVSVSLTDPVDAGTLVDLLEEPPVGAYRLKGRVRVRGPRKDHGYLVNLVGRMIHVAPLPDPPATSELVAVGLNLDQDMAELQLRAVAEAPTEGVGADGLRRLQRYCRLSE